MAVLALRASCPLLLGIRHAVDVGNGMAVTSAVALRATGEHRPVVGREVYRLHYSPLPIAPLLGGVFVDSASIPYSLACVKSPHFLHSIHLRHTPLTVVTA